MYALVLAGGRPSPQDPLYPLTQGRPKALLPLLGKPMLQWVLDALNASQRITHLLVFGVTERDYPWDIRKEVTFFPGQGSMVRNVLHGLQTLARSGHPDEPVLLVSGDVPAITGAILDWVAENALRLGLPVIYHVVKRQAMEARFPGVKRTYVRLRDMEVCGADVNVAHTRLAFREDDLWERIVAARKSPWRQASLIGWGTLLRLLLRRLTLEEAVRRVRERLGLEATALVSPYPEMAMDVDKPQHVTLLERFLRNRQATGEAASGRPSPQGGA